MGRPLPESPESASISFHTALDTSTGVIRLRDVASLLPGSLRGIILVEGLVSEKRVGVSVAAAKFSVRHNARRPTT